MKNAFFKAIVLQLILTQVLLVSWANEILQYELTQEKIKTVRISEVQSDNYVVIVELNQIHKKEFSNLTKNNIGKRLEIIFNHTILTSAVIKSEINSGIILVGSQTSKETAEKIKERLLPQRPSGCP